ncbi:MAG: sensor histidine kinase [Candidatus Hadarchaeota archaeon]
MLSDLIDLITGRMVLFSIILGAIYWVTEPLILHRSNFMEQILTPYWHEFWMRFMVIVALVLFGGIAQFTINVRKDVEEAFRESEERLENANRELKKTDELKTQFLNVASHELRTPLTPIIAQLQMTLQGYFGELNEEQKKSLEMVLRNTQGLDRLIEDILDISRLESGTMKFIMDWANLNEVIAGVVEIMRPTAEARGIDLIVSLEEVPEIVIDKDRICQVIINLINNAIKFTEEGGKIFVGMKDVGEVMVYVKDTGIGIKEEDQERIFRPFEQVVVDKTGKEGSGLGLAICKGIVEFHGGEIWVESEQGKGSTFTFTIPFDQEVREIKADALSFSLK